MRSPFESLNIRFIYKIWFIALKTLASVGTEGAGMAGMAWLALRRKSFV